MGRDWSLIKRHHLHKPLKKLFFLFWVFVFSHGDVASSSDSDKSALLEFKNSVSEPSGALSSWVSTGSDHCSWFGVTCDSNSRVVALNITGGGISSSSPSCSKFDQFPLYGFGIRRTCSDSNVKLIGFLSPEIAKLTELRVLSVPFNELSGEIPSEIWGMENLEVLDLEGNSISGYLPSSFKGLKSLRVLNLGFNKIVGEIPNSLSGCVSLQVLNLAGNRVNGTIPGFVGGFGDLRGLYLSFNQLTGEVPSEIGDNCGKLEHLELAGNFLVNGIPSSLGNCGGLRSLILYSNLFDEVIPVNLGRLNKLEVLDVSRNSLSGPIPTELGNCSELSVLVLSNLFDPLPNISYSDSDSSLGQSSPSGEFNFFEGVIPAEIAILPKLKTIWAPRVLSPGSLPSDWGVCENLELVNFGLNFFAGEISEGFSRCKKLHFLDLSSNMLTGELTGKLLVPCMTVLDVSGNLLSGSIPRFNYSDCPQIPSLSGYPFEPYDLPSLYLSFFANKMQAGIPLPFIGDVSGLAIYHNFGGNNFTGSLQLMPIGLNRLADQTVYAFLAGENKLTGPFPGDLFEMCNGLNSVIFNVSNNRISGEIPPDIGSMCRSLKLLDASGNQITGTVPPSLGDLMSLVTLNLSWNVLQGPIPSSLGKIRGLKLLSLAGNNLTGSIPTNLSQLNSLEVLELSSNSLTGEIPKDIVNLRNLTVLTLNNNKLSGQIPSSLATVTALSTFNVSYNNLSGPLPLHGNLMKCSSVLGNPFLQPCHGFSLTAPSSDPQNLLNYDAAPPPSPPGKSGNGGLNPIEIASITSASAIVSVLLALIVLFFYTKKWNARSRIGGSSRKEVTIFTDIGVPLTFEDVVRATGTFNASNCIGSGGFGATYKAEISPGVLVAIKRLAVGRFQGVQQFDAEIRTLGRLRHSNLVTLIGYHASETEMFLIYNYLPGGNLEKFIQERSTRAVDWRILHKIALDIARALAYLHDVCVPRVLHRDVKPSNILLDDDYNAYLSDFGLARLLGTSETHATTGVAGTFGYVAPEYAMTCRVSDKADVYSYGVVLLELISDKKALDPSFSSFGNGFNIVAWACMLLRQGRAKEFFTAGLWDAGPHDDLVEVLHLAVVCTVDSLSTRPTMKQVERRLKQLQPPSC